MTGNTVLKGGVFHIDTNMIVKRPHLYEALEKELLSKKTIYVSGHTGWGKTTAVLDFMKTSNKSYTYLSAVQENFQEMLEKVSDEFIVIDDLHNVTLPQDEQLILKVIATHTNSGFILIGRSTLPAYLKPFQLTSQLVCFDIKWLRFNKEMISQLLELYKLLDPVLPMQVEAAAKGYTMAVSFLINRLANGEPMNSHTVEMARIDIFDCYDEILFKNWDSDVQKLLLHMASFEEFTEKMAGMVTGKKNVITIIGKAMRGGSYITIKPPDTYCIHPLFHSYLKRKQRLLCSKEFVHSTYHNAALYYELEDDIGNALKYYKLCGDIDKISELLIINSKKHPGNGHYYETERYYRALPKEAILESPELMCGMCMLCSLCCQTEESEYWFAELEQYGGKLNKHDKNYKLTQGKLCYLKIALPHRGSKNITAILLDVAKAYSTGAFRLQEFSVTSNLPSVLNGGKDFSQWVCHDRKLYYLMKKPCELILGRYGSGIADIALAESLFEKSDTDNLTEIMMLANAGQNAASFRGTLEMEFAAVGISSRMMLRQNNIDSAYTLLQNIKKRAEDAKMQGLTENIEALRIMLALVEGKTNEVDLWLCHKAPNENKQFRILDRYRYLAKVRCYISAGKNADALNLLGKLLDYFKSYDRTFGRLDAGILLAITEYRMGQSEWQKTLNDTLVQCEKYGFIRFIAEEGTALLPLLQKASLSTSKEYAERILKETRHYALLYPNYLKSKKVLLEPLTDSEKTVLRLLCKGLSNDEIAELMGISLRTVKFHTGNLYGKMNVKGRVQAIKNAADLI